MKLIIVIICEKSLNSVIVTHLIFGSASDTLLIGNIVKCVEDCP